MADVVTSENIVPAEAGMFKRISWPAVFGGTFVALATELLFAAFGLFIGFTLSPGGITPWAEAWYFVTAFVALFCGGWVASRLSVNTLGSGTIHGAVTWGLTTMATFTFAVWLTWGLIGTSIAAIRTTLAASNVASAAPAPAAQVQANRVENGAAYALNQANRNAPQIAGIVAGDASTLFLVIFGGILCGCVASLLGGSLAGPHGLYTKRTTDTRTNREPAPAARTASA